MFRRGIQSSGRRALSSSRLAVGRCLRAKTVYSGGNRMATIRTLSVTNKVMLPSHEMVPLPALSPTMEVGTIKSWEVKVGDSFEEGDILCEVETDKAVVAFEAVGVEGYIAAILKPEGSKDIKVGEMVCVVVEEEGDIAAFKDFKVGDAPAAAAPAAAPAAPAAAPSTPPPAAAPAASNYPSHEVITLPALSPTMETGSIIAWGIKVGDEVIEGETAIAEIETDKATITFEATGIEGYVAAILYEEGAKDIKLGEPLFIVVEEESDVPKFKDFTLASVSAGGAPAAAPVAAAAPAAPAAAPAAAAGVAAAAAVAAPVVQTGDRLKASPYAKKLASEKNVPLNQLAGSGPGGRIVANDVNSYVPSAAAPAAAPVQAAAAAPVSAPAGLGAGDFTDLDLTNMRKTIASRLCESKNSIPHYYLTRTIRTDAINELRGQLNQISDVKISVNDFIIKAASLACLKVPEANSAWMGETIRQYNVVDMSVAVATPNGLITPIVFDSHTKGLAQISSDVKRLAAKARDGKLQPAEFVGGTFTISNLGMMGIDHFTAIINPPQSCILAVGGNTQRLIPSDNNEKGFEVVTEMKVTLSCDHRTVDGAVGAQWLKHFAEFIENPITMHLYP